MESKGKGGIALLVGGAAFVLLSAFEPQIASDLAPAFGAMLEIPEGAMYAPDFGYLLNQDGLAEIVGGAGIGVSIALIIEKAQKTWKST